MKASYNWLKEFVDFSLSPGDLAHTLTMSGFEVEAIEESGDDIVFDIGVTPNRPDCLSIRGIAREISAILDLPFRDTLVELRNPEGDGPEVEIKNPDLCLRYAARTVTGTTPAPSPQWLSERLQAHGIRPTSNIVDITNYVLLEFGQPLHAFDLDKLAGKKIVVSKAGDETTFQTLDEAERKLSSEMLLIRDAERPVAIAGVMGGMNTEVSESTSNILLESAYFNPVSIRRTSKALNHSTESSYRFERGVDITNVQVALDRAAGMIAEIAGGKVSGLTDIYPLPYVSREIILKPEKIISLLGIGIEESFIEKVLTSLGFVIKRSEEGIVVVPPSYREDIQNNIDIAEEVVRLYGYDNIPSTLPEVGMTPAPVKEIENIIMTVKNSMLKSGFSEVINFSFINPDVLDKLNIPSGDKRRDLLFVKNPLRKEESAMRTTLIPSLLDNISLNLNRGEKMLRFFEVSRVFLPSGGKLPDEPVQLAALFHKDMGVSLWSDKHDGFYDLKGAVENLFMELKIKGYSFKQETTVAEPYLHPGKSCSIILDNQKVGSLGTLHPGVAGVYDIKGNINILEIYDIEKILSAVPTAITYTPLPRYPYVERDVAIVVSKDVTVEQARNAIFGIDSDLIETVALFDIYTGKPIPDDKKSLAFSIRYRSAEKTLTDSEVDAVHSRILKNLENDLNAELRS